MTAMLTKLSDATSDMTHTLSRTLISHSSVRTPASMEAAEYEELTVLTKLVTSRGRRVVVSLRIPNLPGEWMALAQPTVVAFAARHNMLLLS